MLLWKFNVSMKKKFYNKSPLVEESVHIKRVYFHQLAQVLMTPEDQRKEAKGDHHSSAFGSK